jgi:hypothetical protein
MSPELLSVALLMIVRVGLPFVIVMGLSYLAYRWLGEGKDAGQVSVRPAQQPSIGGPAPIARVIYAGAHCWDAKQCPADLKAACPAYAKPELPCWLAMQMKTGHLTANCSGCDFYERPVISL